MRSSSVPVLRILPTIQIRDPDAEAYLQQELARGRTITDIVQSLLRQAFDVSRTKQSVPQVSPEPQTNPEPQADNLQTSHKPTFDTSGW